MFKLIAVRPLKGCRSSALKCLIEDQMYYFCNDYFITDDGICMRDEYVKPTPDSFFIIGGNTTIQMNVSAIVGKNGEGKSTLVELIMRLINNCAKHYNLTDKDSLLRIKQIKGELYYEIDNVVYCIKETAEDTYTSLLKYADISDRSIRKWKKLMTPVKSVYKLNELFYTIVSNYSHYAYNTKDFREEWDDDLKVKNESEKCWLHYLFHKNDGYLTPMTIHPFRDKGNVDVNVETELTMQRLMALYIQEPNPKKNNHSFRRIGEKDAEILCLTDIGSSKLQQQSIVQFFKDNKSVSLLSRYIQIIEENIKKHDDIVFESLKENKLEIVETSLDLLTGYDEPAYQEYLNKFVEWISKKRGVYSSKSDIRLLLFAFQKFNNSIENENLPYDRFIKKYKRYDKLNVRQLTRLRFIYLVMILWGFSTDILLKEYSWLTDVERCQHYIVYKTIDICATYPKYRDMLDKADSGWNNLSLVLREDVFIGIIDEIKKDRSHVTLKLRQCLNFIENHEKEKTNVYEKLNNTVILKKFDNKYDGSLLVKFDDLKNYYQQDPFPLDLLPPPIYKTEVLYQTVKQEEGYIPYRFLSSGEKQLLNNFGAIIYHLRNLDSVSDDGKRYENINIFLEEIELYFHPEYQRMILMRLLEKIQAITFNNIKRINVIFVTHSPFILSDIPENHVLYLGKNDRRETTHTFGANIYDLLQGSFFLDSDIGELAYTKINEMIDIYNQVESEKRRKDFEDKYYEFEFVLNHIGEVYLRKIYEQMFNKMQEHYKPKIAKEMWRQKLNDLNAEKEWLEKLLNDEGNKVSVKHN